MAGLALAICAAAPAAAGDLTVFAAASMKNAMDAIADGFAAETGEGVVTALAASSALARQIEQGAPADIFISANPDWMDRLEDEGLILAESRFDLLGNTIVLIGHGAAVAPVTIDAELDLVGALGEGRLAMALVEAAPAGIYAKAALTSLGLWAGVAPQVAQTDNVRAALALVATGEAPLGVVYATDAAAEEGVSILGVFPPDTHPAIVYPAAAVAASVHPLNAPFLAYLRGPVARAAFMRQGFVVLPE